MPPDFLLCRFCAKRRSTRSIIELKIDSQKQRGIAQKLSIFCEDVVDFTNLSLPQNICKDCFDALNTSNEFFKGAKKAQEILAKFFVSVDVKECHVNLEPLEPEFGSVEVDVCIELKPSLVAWALYPWCCCHCNTYLPSLEELIHHSQDVHSTCCAFKCDDCTKEPVGFDEFVDHVRGHRPYLKDYCPHCNIEMDSPSHEDTHIAVNKCKFCGECFEEPLHLLAHLKKYVTKISKNTELLDVIQDIDIERKNIDQDNLQHSDKNADFNDFIDDMCDHMGDADTKCNENDSQVGSKSLSKVCINEGEAAKNGSFTTSFNHQVTDKIRKEELAGNNELILGKLSTEMSIKVKKIKRKRTEIELLLSNTKIMKIDIASQITTRRKHVMENSGNSSFKPDNPHETSKNIDKGKTNEHDSNIKKPERKPSSDESSSDEDEKVSCTDDEEEWCEEEFNKNNIKPKPKRKTKVVAPQEIMHWSEYPLVCRCCEEIFSSRKALRKHSIKLHGNCFGMKCVDCDDDESQNVDQFMLHVVKHRPNLRFVCLWCDKSMKDFTHLEEHNSKHHCTICGHNFSSTSSLTNHWKATGISKKDMCKFENEKRGQCDVCNKHVNDLLVHKRIHKRTRDFTCEACGKSFYEYNHLHNHAATHDLTQRVQCKICGIYKQCMQHLKKHIKTHNVGVKYQCDHCKKFFPSKCYLREHMVSHIDKKDFVCPDCGKRFKRKSGLRNHSRSHYRVELLSCELCGEKFKYYASLANHRTKVHGVGCKTMQTAYGRLSIDPATGQPVPVSITDDVIQWSRDILYNRKRRPRKKNDL